jgi:hypothetical protein
MNKISKFGIKILFQTCMGNNNENSELKYKWELLRQVDIYDTFC